MSTIQNLKNFIRHGKQARATNNNSGHAEPVTNVSPVHAQQQRFQGHSEPNPERHLQQHAVNQQVHGDFSAANVDNRNVAAQAGTAAAKAQGDHQKVDRSRHDAEIARIVEEERIARGKMPKYPGLERWIIVEKMGDGAFSNVYRAKDTQGQYGEVAIKVVRKFEMNANQVSNLNATFAQPLLPHPNELLSFWSILVRLLPTKMGAF